MIGGSIPGETKVLSILLYEHVENQEYLQAHWLAGGMVLFCHAGADADLLVWSESENTAWLIFRSGCAGRVVILLWMSHYNYRGKASARCLDHRVAANHLPAGTGGLEKIAGCLYRDW